MSMASDLIAGLNAIMAAGGTLMDLYSPDGTLKVGMTLGAFVNWTTEDQVLANDYDKEAQKLYLKAITPEPKKQDYILQGGNRWTILDTHPRIIQGNMICWVCVVRK